MDTTAKESKAMAGIIYKEVTIQAAQGGWVYKVKGKKESQVFVHWGSMIRKLELDLTNKGENDV